MKRLLNFIFRFQGFFTFLILEIFCSYLIVSNNTYQSASFFSSANFLAASITQTSNSIKEYFYLKTYNKQLAEENALLKKRLENFRSHSISTELSGRVPYISDTTDSLKIPYGFITAKVINNSTDWRNNSLTLDKGRRDGLAPGMGVVGENGLVGKIKYVSNDFAVVTSLLHTGFTVSSRIAGKVEVCTTEWDGTDPKIVSVKYVPRYHQIQVGDTVMTSGYNSIFPSDYIIGFIKEVELKDDANFYDLKAEIINDFTTLSYVHVIINYNKEEKDSLENILE
jgi:rod shape-determining protein MreC